MNTPWSWVQEGADWAMCPLKRPGRCGGAAWSSLAPELTCCSLPQFPQRWGKTGATSIWAVAGPHRAPCLSARHNAGIIGGVCPSCFHLEPEGSPRLVNQGRAESSASEGSKLGGRRRTPPFRVASRSWDDVAQHEATPSQLCAWQDDGLDGSALSGVPLLFRGDMNTGV